MVIKFILLQILLTFSTQKDTPLLSKVDKGIYEVVKVSSYKGNNLEAVYKITYKSTLTNNLRFFEVIKTDSQIKNYFLADFLLVEKVKNNPGLICYPTGWESVKYIKEAELRETCQMIVTGKLASEAIQ